MWFLILVHIHWIINLQKGPFSCDTITKKESKKNIKYHGNGHNTLWFNFMLRKAWKRQERSLTKEPSGMSELIKIICPTGSPWPNTVVIEDVIHPL